MRLVLGVCLLWPVTVQASALEVYGVGAEGTAGGLSSATAHGPLATYGNPAFLTAEKGGRVQLGFQGGLSALKIQGSTVEPAQASASQHTVIGLQLPLGQPVGRALAMGLILQTPQGLLVRSRGRTPSQPHWAFHDGYAERFVSVLSLSWEMGAGLALGLGSQSNVGLAGQVHLGLDPATQRWVRRDLDFRFFGTWTPIFGLRWARGPFELGFSHRRATEQEYNVPADLAVQGLEGSLDLGLAGLTHFTPDSTELGLRWQRDRRRWLSLGLLHRRWSQRQDPTLDASLAISGDDAEQLGLDAALSAPPGDEPRRIDPAYSDTLSFALAGAWALSEAVALQGSYGFEASPVPEQTGFFNEADGDNHQLGWGVTYDFGPQQAAAAWSLSLAGRHRYYPERSHQKTRATDPTGSWQAGGLFHVLVLEFGRRF